MILDPEFDALILTPVELEVLGKRFAGEQNILAISVEAGSKEGDAKQIWADFNQLENAVQKRFTSTLQTLGDPLCTAELHYTIAEHTITRSHLAWPKVEGESLSVLTNRAEDFALTSRSAQEIEALMGQILAVDEGLATANLAVDLTAVTTLVAIGLMDAFRFSQLQSWLTHKLPDQGYSALEVMERIRDASSEDFRWPLLFYEKILPTGSVASITEAEIIEGFKILDEAGLILSLTEEDSTAPPDLYSFSNAGELIADGLMHAASKVALRVSRLIGEGEVGHEAFLFIRDPNYLWLFDVAGQEGVVASLDRQCWGELSSQILHPPLHGDHSEDAAAPSKEDIHEAATVMRSELHVRVASCPKCGGTVKVGNQFCSSCGAAIK
jgi:hypothetical protein